MNTLNKFRKSKYAFIIICAGIFFLMLVCNFLTSMCADDYAYCFSFKTGQRIENVWDIFPSLAAHRESMNGRLIAHFFAQLFLFLPSYIFKIINSAMFLAQILLIYKICKKTGEHNNFVLISIFCLIWVFEPAFGQVNLWIDGACNYLWSSVFGLLFLIPVLDCFLDKDKKYATCKKILYIGIGFIAGGYLENLSAAIILMDFLLLMLIYFYNKKKVEIHYIIGLIVSIISYILMATAPGEIKNKVSKAGLSFYRENFINTVETFKIFWILALFFIILFIFALFIKVDKKRIIISSLFVLGSLCSNFIFIVASYYPLRSAFCSVIFLVVADCILMINLFSTKYDVFLLCSVGALMMMTFYYGCIGVNDIYETHCDMERNVSFIQQCKENGQLDVELPMIKSNTKYSAVNSSKYLDTVDCTSWPNTSIADYYEINTVIGK